MDDELTGVALEVGRRDLLPLSGSKIKRLLYEDQRLKAKDCATC